MGIYLNDVYYFVFNQVKHAIKLQNYIKFNCLVKYSLKNSLHKMGKYFRYGLVGNLIFYGGSLAALGYTLWLIWDMSENQSVKMSPKLFK